MITEEGLEGLSVAYLLPVSAWSQAALVIVVTACAAHRQPFSRMPIQLPSRPTGSQQDVPGHEVFPAKQRETQFSGATGQHYSRHSCQDPNPKTSQCGGPPDMGREGRPCQNTGIDGVFIQSAQFGEAPSAGHKDAASREDRSEQTAESGPSGATSGTEQSPRQQRFERGNLSPLLSPLPSFSLAVAHPSVASTKARPGPGPQGQPHPVQLQLVGERDGCGLWGHQTARGRPTLPGGAALEMDLEGLLT